MNKRTKILVIIFSIVIIIFGLGITYSAFTSGSLLESKDQNIAKFVFETKKLDHLELNLSNLKPGDTDNFAFSVTNNLSSKMSNVTIEYQITIRTLHLMPLEIKLYKIGDTSDMILVNCDESHERNEDNELVCDSSIQELSYSSSKLDDYQIKVSFPDSYNDAAYSNLIDYIDVDIKSWQKIEK